MLDRQVINDAYYCCRVRPDSVVAVLTGNSYVVAEYDDRTGDIRWQRVVNATQKEGIYNWLRDHFPVKTAVKVKAAAPVKTKTPARKARAAVA
ncbi:MAG TPA: hypothetical protein VK789_08025 [Bryobacteraceae bacterium]|jgi:hypothetical protein|nr:hypothetical protein [Bryobacteraceae bacterium]